jgi:hypothetical protein
LGRTLVGWEGGLDSIMAIRSHDGNDTRTTKSIRDEQATHAFLIFEPHVLIVDLRCRMTP